ncbi:tail fiber assembly protein U [Erwinia phage Hena1]|uniref:Tail fiber assembly protein U n=1 Tax=Erwinia phage Hena1 TaxID=2678601 RepID=A0A6B9J8B7_9CAUD|nr:tail fiber assembly protein [Erwinia phage Hena1]QGZ16314.1 tail fiber assembly protein U [Erwinia phage Hena1]
MIHLKNFKIYTPETVPDGFLGHEVVFFQSEDGVDFYQILADMKEDTVKVLYRDDVVVGFSTDASALYPADASLIELKAENIPDDISIDGRFMVDFKKRAVKLNEKAILENTKEQILAEIAPTIEDLQDKVDTGDATDETLETFKQWKAYRIAVRKATTLEELPEKP